MSTLKIKRVSSFMNMRRTMKVIVNEKQVAKIKNDQVIELSLQPGNHEVYAKIDWCRSNKIKLNVQEGENKKLLLQSSDFFNAMFSSIFAPSKYLKFEEV